MILINRILRNFRTIRILRLVSIFGYVLENIMCNIMKFLIFKNLVFEFFTNVILSTICHIFLLRFFSVTLVQRKIYLLLYYNKRSWTIVLCKLVTTQLLDAVIT